MVLSMKFNAMSFRNAKDYLALCAILKCFIIIGNANDTNMTKENATSTYNYNSPAIQHYPKSTNIFNISDIPISSSGEQMISVHATHLQPLHDIFAETASRNKEITNQHVQTQPISDGECADKRSDCFRFTDECQTAFTFVIQGCQRTCGLCPTNGTVKDFHSIPTIAYTIAEQSENGVLNVSFTCNSFLRSYGNTTLFFKCSEKSDQLENIGVAVKSFITSTLFIPVQNQDILINCSCAIQYRMGGQLLNHTSYSSVFLRSKDSLLKPIFYITSGSENGTNITVNESQTVTFVCKHNIDNNNPAYGALSVHKGTQLLTAPQNFTESVSEETRENVSLNYTIQEVQRRDSGVYQCLAVGAHGTVTSTASLSVQCSSRGDGDLYRDCDECSKNCTNAGTTSASNTSLNCEQCSVNDTTSGSERLNNSTVPNTSIIVGVSTVIIIICVFLVIIKQFRVTKSLSFCVVKLYPDQRSNRKDFRSDLRATVNLIQNPVYTTDSPAGSEQGARFDDSNVQGSRKAASKVLENDEGLLYTSIDFSCTKFSNGDFQPSQESTEYTTVNFQLDVRSVESDSNLRM